MLEQPLFFNSPPSAITVSEAARDYLPFTMQYLRDLRDAMLLHWSPNASHLTLARGEEDFPRGGKLFKLAPLLTC